MQLRRQPVSIDLPRALAGVLAAGLPLFTAACANTPAGVPPIALAPHAAPPVPAPAPVPITGPAPVAAAAAAPLVLANWTTSVTPNARGPRLASLAPAKSPRLETGALSPAPVPAGRPSITGPSHTLSGLASYYWQAQQTASGEMFDKRAMTAAHKTLPLGTRVRVTDLVSGRSVIVRINDRGPFKPGRIIDISEAAAEQLGMTRAGVVPVKLEVVKN